MAQAPAMPVWTDALIGDTTHLSAEEFGTYCLILFATWRNNGRPLANDDVSLARVARTGLNRWANRLKPRLIQFFDISDGYLHQKRLEIEWEKAVERIKKQSEKGKRSAHLRRLKNNETVPTAVGVRFQPIVNQPYPLSKKDSDSPNGESSPLIPPTEVKPHVRRNRKTRLPPDWEPSEQGRAYARERGLDPDWMLIDFRDYWTDPDTRNALHSDWSRVWQRRCRDLYDRKGSNGATRPRQDMGRNQGVLAIAHKLILEAADN